MNGIVVSRSFHIADNAECNREVWTFHQGKLQLQGIVHAVGIVDEDILLCNAVFTEFHDFQTEAFLHQSVFIVLAEEHRFAMLQVDGILGTVFLLGHGVMRTVVEDDAVLQNLANGSALVGQGCQSQPDGMANLR